MARWAPIRTMTAAAVMAAIQRRREAQLGVVMALKASGRSACVCRSRRLVGDLLLPAYPR